MFPSTLLLGGRSMVLRLDVTWIACDIVWTADFSSFLFLQPITKDPNGFHHVFHSLVCVVRVLDALGQLNYFCQSCIKGTSSISGLCFMLILTGSSFLHKGHDLCI